jgi:hypothetical protein
LSDFQNLISKIEDCNELSLSYNSSEENSEEETRDKSKVVSYKFVKYYDSDDSDDLDDFWPEQIIPIKG